MLLIALVIKIDLWNFIYKEDKYVVQAKVEEEKMLKRKLYKLSCLIEK